MVNVLGEDDFLPVERGSHSLRVPLMDVIQLHVLVKIKLCL